MITCSFTWEIVDLIAIPIESSHLIDNCGHLESKRGRHFRMLAFLLFSLLCVPCDRASHLWNAACRRSLPQVSFPTPWLTFETKLQIDYICHHIPACACNIGVLRLAHTPPRTVAADMITHLFRFTYPKPLSSWSQGNRKFSLPFHACALRTHKHFSFLIFTRCLSFLDSAITYPLQTTWFPFTALEKYLLRIRALIDYSFSFPLSVQKYKMVVHSVLGKLSNWLSKRTTRRCLLARRSTRWNLV